jgi:hypothetical protein
MKSSCLLSVFLFAAVGAAASAQEPASLMTPLTEHVQLARDAGVWEGESQMWAAPGTEPMTSKGVETVETLGPFWLVSEFVGDLMGQEFKGRSQLGYDPVKKKYVGTWIDTMSATMLTMTGDYDVATHTLTMMMEGIDGMTGQPGKWKSVTRYEDENTKVFEMYAPVEGQDGEWWKMMEVKYKRRK